MISIFNHEKELYPIIERFLKEQKNCIDYYTGNEFHMGEARMRSDVYGVSKDREIYLLEGKLKLEGRIHFSKVLCEAMPLLEYADFVYIFGIPDDMDFQVRNKRYLEVCELLGIGIILVNENGDLNILLEAKKTDAQILLKKETIYRIFLKKIGSPISNLIFQACFEYITLRNDGDNCAQFIEIYENLFSNKEYKNILRKVLPKHSLNKKGMRREFQNKFINSDLVKITRMDTVYEDYICLTDKGMEKGKYPVLLDNLKGD